MDKYFAITLRALLSEYCNGTHPGAASVNLYSESMIDMVQRTVY